MSDALLLRAALAGPSARVPLLLTSHGREGTDRPPVHVQPAIQPLAKDAIRGADARMASSETLASTPLLAARDFKETAALAAEWHPQRLADVPVATTVANAPAFAWVNRPPLEAAAYGLQGYKDDQAALLRAGETDGGHIQSYRLVGEAPPLRQVPYTPGYLRLPGPA